MKRTTAFILVLLFVLALTPVFADKGSGGVSFFQKASDSFAKLNKPTGQSPSAWVSIFQKAKANIETWDDTTDQAKSLSLRGNESELARRRNIKR